MDVSKFDWLLLKSFLAVIDAGSLLGAAKRLGSHQPTISRQIAELESQLGVPLFERTGRGLTPTTAALSIVDAARGMAEAAQEVATILRNQVNDGAGTVRIASSQVIANYVLPEVLVKLRHNFPAIQIEVVVSNQISNLLRREADIALRMVMPTQASLITKKIAELPMGIFAAKRYLRVHGEPKDLAALTKHDLIGLDQDEALIRGLGSSGLPATREMFALRCDDQIAIIKLVEAGAGIGFFPCYVGQKLKNVQHVLQGIPGPALPIWLTVHREIRGNPLIRTVFDFLDLNIRALISGK